MADNYLITGYWGEPHVTAENDRGINAATFGFGRFVMPIGEQFRAEYIGNNTIRMYDGKLMDNGAAAGIPVGTYVDLLIPEASQGMNRNDLIIFQYEQDTSTLIESGQFVVVHGTEVSGTAADPALTEQDLMTGEAVLDQMALWRVSVSGTTISAPVQLFTVRNVKAHEHSTDDLTSGILPLSRGGTGASSASAARTNLGVPPATHASQHKTGGSDPIAPSDIGAAINKDLTASVSTSWTTDATNGGYYQTVSVSGVLATDKPVVDVVLGTDVDANELYLEAWGYVSRITTAANSITLWANSTAPSVAFTIQIKVVR